MGLIFIRRASRIFAAPVAIAFASACGGTSKPAKSSDAAPSSAASSSTASPAPKLLTDAAELRIVMANGRFSLNGNPLPDSPMLADFEQFLGPADRVSNLANRLHTYDKLGLVLYENSGYVNSVSVVIGPEDYDFSPHSIFTGKLTVDGTTLERKTAFETVSKMPGAARIYGTSVHIVGKGHELFLSGNVSRGGITNVELEFKKPAKGAASATDPSAADDLASQPKSDFDLDALLQAAAQSQAPPPGGAKAPPTPAPAAKSPSAGAGSCPAGAADCGTYCCLAGAQCDLATQQCVRWVKQCPGGTSSCGDGYCCPYGTTCASGGMCRRSY